MPEYICEELNELYIENQSVFEEVWEGLEPVSWGLRYLGVDPDSELAEYVRECFEKCEPPL